MYTHLLKALLSIPTAPFREHLVLKFASDTLTLNQLKNGSLHTRLVKWLFIFVCVVCYARIYFGIDTLDEGSHVAYSLTLAKGRQPLIDERDFRQSMAWLLSPIVTPYLRFMGMDYLVLFMRHISYFTAFGVALLVVRLRRKSGYLPAYLSAAFLMTFVPYSILSFNYLRHAFLFNVAGALLWIESIEKPRPLARLIAAQILFFFSGILFPTQILFSIGVNGICLFLRKQRGHRVFGEAAAILITWIVFTILSFWWVDKHGGAPALREVVRYHQSVGHGGGAWKVLEILSGLRFYARFFGFAIVGIFILHQGIDRRRKGFLIFVPVAFCAAFFQGWNNSLGVIPGLWVIVLSFFFICFGARDDRWRILSIPSLFSGMISAWTSSLPVISLAYGLFPAMVGWLLLEPPRVWKFAPVLNVLVLALFTFSHVAFVPQDGRYSTLTENFQSGPFAGIYTSKGVAEFLKKFEADIAPLSGGFITIYPNFPAGYFFSKGLPNMPSTCFLGGEFIHNRKDYGDYARRYLLARDSSKFVVQMREVPWQRGRMEAQRLDGDPVIDLSKNHRLLIDRKQYQVWERILG